VAFDVDLAEKSLDLAIEKIVFSAVFQRARSESSFFDLGFDRTLQTA
jgi:hypothetical protein